MQAPNDLADAVFADTAFRVGRTVRKKPYRGLSATSPCWRRCEPRPAA